MEPKLRFKEFSGDWKEKRLGDIVTFLDGKRKPLEKGERISGKYPYYGASGIIDYVKDYIFDEELILLSEDGANIIDRNYRVCFLARGKYWVNNHAHVLKAKENNYNAFVCEALERLNYQKYNTGTAQPKLNQDVCKKIILNTPSLPEQTKIADFLSTVDEKIQNQQDKITHLENIKKGFMQKIFSRKIRFKDANGNEFPEWEEEILGNVVNIIMGQSPNSNSYNEDKIGVPLVQGNADIKNRITSPTRYTNKPTKICKKDSLIMTVRAPVGYIGKANQEVCIGRGVCEVQVKKSNSDYIYQFLLSKEDSWDKISQGSTFTSISSNDIKNLRIELPYLEEQQKIADFLSSFDEKIDTEKDILEHLKELKKGLLQQMFV